jgi:magnesium transporter
MTYDEETAGGIMTTEFVAVPANLTAGQTIDRLRELEPTAETIYYVYVTDSDDRLVGVLSLRDLIVAKPETVISTFMYDEPVALRTDSSQEEVTDVVARYNLLALPIVDAEGRLEGIVTVDDAMDTLLPQPSKRRIPHLFSRSGTSER